MKKQNVMGTIGEKRLLNIREVCIYTGIGQTRARQYMDKIGANSAEKVNTPITDYKKVKINNHDDFNSQIDKYVGMYGDDAAKQKAVEVKEAMNKVLADNSDEAWEDAIKKTQELDNMLQGKSYTYKRRVT